MISHRLAAVLKSPGHEEVYIRQALQGAGNQAHNKIMQVTI